MDMHLKNRKMLFSHENIYALSYWKADFKITLMHSTNPRFSLEIVFNHQKAPLFKTLLITGQNKGAFSISGIHKTIGVQRRLSGAFFRFFNKLQFFGKNKGVFSFNKAPASILQANGAISLKTMDFQQTLDKKLRA